MIKTIEEARKVALEKIPGTRVASEHEKSEYFVINLVPINYTESSGIFVGGGMRVDKKTGKVSIYNPLHEKDILSQLI